MICWAAKKGAKDRKGEKQKSWNVETADSDGGHVQVQYMHAYMYMMLPLMLMQLVCISFLLYTSNDYLTTTLGLLYKFGTRLFPSIFMIVLLQSYFLGSSVIHLVQIQRLTLDLQDFTGGS